MLSRAILRQLCRCCTWSNPDPVSGPGTGTDPGSSRHQFLKRDLKIKITGAHGHAHLKRYQYSFRNFFPRYNNQEQEINAQPGNPAADLQVLHLK